MRLCVLFLLTLALVPSMVSADQFMSLEEGNRWAYSGDIVGPDIKVALSGPDPLFYNSYPLLYDVSDHSLGLRNFWSVNDSGDVYLHGFARMSPRVSYFYEPPLQYVDGPLYPGKTWSSSAALVEFPGGPAVGYLNVQYTVTEPESIVIAGEEHLAYGVLESQSSAVAGVGSDWATDGRPFDLAKEGDVVVPHWWVEGIGEVRYRSIGIFDLVDYYFRSHVANDNMSWSDLKQNYR